VRQNEIGVIGKLDMPRMPAHLFVEDVGGDGMTRQCLQK
jgi:hypothetical protein